MPPPRKRLDAVIAGAGLSGLAAAYELRKAGYDVEVLEAQTRPGGRILTLRSGFADGMYAEAGAMSFPDSEPLVMQYVAEFNLGLQRKRRPDQFHYYFLRNQLINDHAPNVHWPGLTADEQKLGPAGLMKKYLLPTIEKIGDPTAPGWPTPEIRKLDEVSGAEFVRRQGASAAAVRLLGLGLFNEDGDGFEACSALFLLAWFAQLYNYTALYTLLGGMELLPRAFADRLQDRIRYGSPIRRIKQSRAGVALEYEQGGETRSIEAQYLICTIPYTVLRHIPVEPAFSARKKKIVAELPCTSVVRTFVQSRTRFWASPDFTGEIYTDLPVANFYSAYDGPGARGILESYSTGDQARKLAAKAPAQQLNAALNSMSKVFPQMREQAEGGMVKDWDEDPWARGAYTWYRPGEFLEMFPHVADPEGRIHFAGDHTSLIAGWMDGALGSGIRAAGEVQRRLA